MKSIFCIFNSIPNIDKIITIFNDHNYNLKNISIISLNDFLSIKNRLKLDFKINNLISEKKIKDLIIAKLILITQDNYLLLTGPVSNYFDNKNLKELNDILLTVGLSEENIDLYIDSLNCNKFLFIFPINEKNENELIYLLKNNNAEFLIIN